MSGVDVHRLAARRAAALRRNARRVAAAEAEESDEEIPTEHDDAHAIVGRAITTTDGNTDSHATKLLRSSHDERRAINNLIYGRLNQVESSKFEPATFVSSRSARAAAATTLAGASTIAEAASHPDTSTVTGSSRPLRQRPEDFMDAEDRSGGTNLTTHTSVGGSFIPTKLLSGLRIVGVRSEELEIRLLKGCGWREETNPTGASASRKRKMAGDQNDTSTTRVYGVSLPPGMVLDSDSKMRPDESMSDAVAYRMLEMSEASHSTMSESKKNDTCGLGYVPYSQLSNTAKSKHQPFAPLTFVKAKQIDATLSQPTVYSITVPADFDGQHHYEPPAPPPPTPPTTNTTQPSPANLIAAWMDAQRRMMIESYQRGSLPLPPMPPRSTPPTVQPPTQPVTSLTASAQPTPPPSSSSNSGIDPAALEAHAAHLRRLQEQQQMRHRSGANPMTMTSHAPIHPTTSLPLPPPPPPQPRPGFTPDGRIDIRAAISAASAAAASMLSAQHAAAADGDAVRRAERRARWGPIPTATEQDAKAFPVAAAFLNKISGAIATGDSAATSLPTPPEPAPAQPLPPPPPAPAAVPTSSSPSLAVLFPKFVVSGGDSSQPVTATPSDASGLSKVALAGMMSNFVEAGASTTETTADKDTSNPSSLPPGVDAATSIVSGPKPLPPPSNPYDAAARMGMFGKLTREIEDWTPHPLLYKRFGVPQPTKGATRQQAQKKNAHSNSSSGVSVPGFPSFVQSDTPFGVGGTVHGGLSVPNAPSGSSIATESPADVDRAYEEALQSELMLADEDEDEDDGDKDGATGVGVLTGAGAPSKPIEEEIRPSIDLFKAIFENEDEPRPKPKPKSVNKPSHANHQPQQITTKIEPLFASGNTAAGNAKDATQIVTPLHAARPPPSTAASSREVISIDDDDDDGDVGVVLTGFGGGAKRTHEKLTPASFQSRVDKLEFVPANTRQHGKQKPPSASSSAVAAAAAARRARFRVGIDGEEDDLYDDPMDLAPASAPIVSHVTLVPPPVKVHVKEVLPPPVAASWPFPSFTHNATMTPTPTAKTEPPSSSSSSNRAIVSSVASVPPSSTSATATPSTSTSVPAPTNTTALLEHLLQLRQEQKRIRKEAKKESKKKDDGSSSKKHKTKKLKKHKKKKHKSKRRRDATSSSSDATSGSDGSSGDMSDGSTDSERSRTKDRKERKKDRN